MKSERRRFGKVLIFVVLFAALAFLSVSIGCASESTIYVPDDYEKIQRTVNNASAADTIINFTVIAKLLSIIGLCLGMLGTYFLGKGLLMKNEKVEEISTTYCGENPNLMDKFRRDRRDAKIGFVFLGLGFLLQCISQFF